MQVADWLEQLGLGQYARSFVDNGVDLTVLPELTDQDLKRLGVLLGHRRKMLRAIRELGPALVGVVTATHSQPAVPEAQPHEAAERRQLTVMFCDLVGSTTLSTRLDPEDLRGIVNAYHRCATELVEGNGGFVAKYMGDGVLAYFGYPRASEHDAERAVRAGLAIVEAVPKLATAAGSPLQVRVGIATGLVVVGETPNLAARLQALAEPGAVVISGSTHRLTGGLFEYRDLGAVALKGFAEGTPAWQVLGASAAESRFEALRTANTPMVGRDEEIDLLMRRWEQAKRGDGQVVLICGEPGIGKSRISQAIVERVSGEPHTRLRYFCSPHHQDSALYPSIAQLERAAGFRRDDTPEQRLEKLETVLAQGTNDFSEAVPLLAELLSIPTGDRYPPLNLTPQRRKERMLHAQLAQVEGLASRQPVLMVWEDIHWSDPTTREALDLIVPRATRVSGAAEPCSPPTCRPVFPSAQARLTSPTALTNDRPHLVWRARANTPTGPCRDPPPASFTQWIEDHVTVVAFAFQWRSPGITRGTTARNIGTSEETMRLCSFVVSTFLIGLAVPVSAQEQSKQHLYMIQFKATAQSAKEMIDNPQDRTGPSGKLFEAFGGKVLDYYVYPPGEYDGMLIVELPDEMAVRAAAMTVLSAGAVEKLNIVPLITAKEWKKVMETAKQTVSGYTAPAQTK